MAFRVLLSLMILCSCFITNLFAADNVAPHHAPSYSPAGAPSPHHHKPASPPITQSPAPVHPPLPARKLVAVQGVVFCKGCKYVGVDTLFGAAPLEGAVVQLACNNTKHPLKVKGTSDPHGYFFIMAPNTLTTYGAHKCKVTLVGSPMATCNRTTNLHNGVMGAMLVPSHKPPGSTHPLPYDVFNVGPLAFEPSSKDLCTH